jgi:hypothetical protein
VRRALQLRGRDGLERSVRPEDHREVDEAGLVPHLQLHFELQEPVDHPPAGDDLYVVDAQLDFERIAGEGARAPQLADRDDLDERGVAGVLQDERTGG